MHALQTDISLLVESEIGRPLTTTTLKARASRRIKVGRCGQLALFEGGERQWWTVCADWFQLAVLWNTGRDGQSHQQQQQHMK